MERRPHDWRSTQLPRETAVPQRPESSQLKKQPKELSIPKLNLRKKPRRVWLWAAAVILIVVLFTSITGFLWFQNETSPVDANSKKAWRVKIEQGETVGTIANTLKEQGLIRSTFAFQLHAQLTQSKNSLQAGTYVFSPSQPVSTIISHLVEGKVDAMMVTILPGDTLFDIQKKLQENYGFSPEEVEQAFTKEYSHPILASKPKGASLEGYIYPETYQMSGSDSVESLLTRSFDQLQQQLNVKNLPAAFKVHKLSVHQAVILASIIQKEVTSEKDMQQVAQIFYKRMKQGTALEADSTFIYGAKLLGVEPTVSLQSPYNTRRVKGLPPGPIANPGITALNAVGHPAKGDYLFFVSGDDGTTYFSRTIEEHEAYAAKYCRKNCSIFSN